MSADIGRFQAFEPAFTSPPLSPGTIEIREAVPADAAGVAALATLEHDGDAGPSPDKVRSWADRHDRWLVVAVSDERVVGYGRAAWFEPDADAPDGTAPPGWYLGGLMVDPAWRGRGIARELTRARLDWIAERATEAWYFTNERNAVSRRLHTSLGFEEVTRDFSFPGVSFGGGVGVLGRVGLPTPTGSRGAPDPR